MSQPRSDPTGAFRPTKQQLAEATGQTVADVIAADLAVLFVGINPGLYTAAIGHHFGRPGNRFWPVMHLSGFTPRLYSPFEERLLLAHGLGITNIVARASARADELSKDELLAGAVVLRDTVAQWKPRFVAVLGVTAYRTAFAQPRTQLGRQPEPMGESTVWVLPNPSGLNAHFQIDSLARLFAELRESLPRLVPGPEVVA